LDGLRIDCASVAVRNNGPNGTFVTVRTSTGRVLEAACATRTFPTQCDAFVPLGRVPMSTSVSPTTLRQFAASQRPE
jgi:hypothetical protein